MDNRNEPFTPETVDEQVDQLLWQQQSPQASQDARLVQGLHRFYNHDYAATHTRVWHRLEKRLSTHPSTPHSDTGILSLTQHLHQLRRNNAMSQESLYPKIRPGVIAATIIVLLLVGSTVWLFGQAHLSRTDTASPRNAHTMAKSSTPAQSATTNQPQPGVYASTGTGVARFDLHSGKTIWTYTLPDLSQLSSFVSVQRIIPAGHTIYIAVTSLSIHYQSRIIALDASNGRMLWQYTFGDIQTYQLDLAVAQGTIYSSVAVASPSPQTTVQKSNQTASNNDQSEMIYALNSTTGKLVAVYAFPAAITGISAAGSTLYLAANDGLYALNLANGKQLWHTPISSESGHSLLITEPRVVNDTLYIALVQDTETNATYSYIAAFNAKNGAQKWRSPHIANQVFDITVANNAIYFGSLSGMLYAYDAQRGTQIWSVPTDGAIQWAPAVANGVVYASAYVTLFHQKSAVQEEIVAVNASNGQTQWKGKVNSGLLTTPIVIDQLLYVASGFNSGTVYALKVSDGSPAWQTPIPGMPQSLLAIP